MMQCGYSRVQPIDSKMIQNFLCVCRSRASRRTTGIIHPLRFAKKMQIGIVSILDIICNYVARQEAQNDRFTRGRLWRQNSTRNSYDIRPGHSCCCCNFGPSHCAEREVWVSCARLYRADYWLSRQHGCYAWLWIDWHNARLRLTYETLDGISNYWWNAAKLFLHVCSHLSRLMVPCGTYNKWFLLHNKWHLLHTHISRTNVLHTQSLLAQTVFKNYRNGKRGKYANKDCQRIP